MASLTKNTETDEKEKKFISPKIYYGSRTHKQIEQVIREFKKTSYANKKMTILSSREYTCIRPREKGRSMTQVCNDLRDPTTRGSCQFYTAENQNTIAWHNNLEKLNFPTPWDIEDLVELGTSKNACPYFAARNLEFEADIIFCPYNYLIDPAIRENLKMSLTGHVVIIDEAHNIEGICREVGSHDLREDNLEEAIDDCKLVYNLTQETEPAYVHIERYLTKFANLIKIQQLSSASNNYEEATSACWTGEETWELFKINKLGDYDFNVFQAACESAINAYQEAKEDLKPKDGEEFKKKKPSPSISYPTKELIESLANALKFIQNPTFNGDYRCTISENFHSDAKVKVDGNTWTTNHQNKRRRLRTFKFMCMNSSLIFGDIAKMARSVVLASGTLSPTSTFESELGTKFAQKLHANHVVPKENVYIRGIGNGPNGTKLKATYQNVQTLPFKDDLGQLLLDVCHVIPHGVLCFFSSYSMMTSQIERWKDTYTWSELLSCKHVLQEPRSNNDLDAVMSEFREVIRSTNEGPNCNGITGSLLLAVFRGKVAEGIDFSDNEARCVLTVGIPYAVQNDPVVKLKREYNDKHRSRGLLAGGEWYTVQAFRALNQALGRCIRHRNDWGAILLVDERLLSVNSINFLPKWIREMRKTEAHYNLKNELTDFVNRLQISDQEKITC